MHGRRFTPCFIPVRRGGWPPGVCSGYLKTVNLTRAPTQQARLLTRGEGYAKAKSRERNTVQHRARQRKETGLDMGDMQTRANLQRLDYHS